MAKVQLFLEGECVGERTWPDIPRKSETLVLTEPQQVFTVEQLEWIEGAHGCTARIHLKRFADPAVN